jgi:glycosyltransferase involved in cell wall biosynthesis
VILASNAGEGGTVNYSNALKRTFEQEGYRVHRMALYRGDNWDRRGFDEIVLPVDQPTRIQRFIAPLRLIGRLRALQPHVIMGVMPMSNVIAAVAAVGTSTKVIASHHSPHDSNSKIAQLLDHAVGSIGAYTDIVAVSHAVARSYNSHSLAYRNKMTVIPNGIPLMAPDAGQVRIRQKYGVTAGRPFVLMAGRLAEQKNVLNAIRAMAMIPEVDFLLSGRGPLEREARALIATLGAIAHVRLIGLVDRQDLVNLMFDCDGFIQVSLYEGQSVALLEGLYAGATLIVSAIPTQLEVVRTPGGPAAATCDASDPHDIARALRAAILDPTARAAIIRASEPLRAVVRTEAEVHRDYLALIKGALGSGRKAIR